MGGHICPWWFAYTFDNRLRHFFHNPEKMLGSYVSKGMTVLDVGCGMGFFSISLAKLVGDKGCVIAADIQTKMLEAMQKRADKNDLSSLIRFHKSEPNNLGVKTPVDFILAFWMVHEVPNPKLFFHQIRVCLNQMEEFLLLNLSFMFHRSASRRQWL